MLRQCLTALLIFTLGSCSESSSFNGQSKTASAKKAKSSEAVPGADPTAEPEITADSNAVQEQQVAVDGGDQVAKSCKATLGTVAVAGDKTQLTITTTGGWQSVYVNGTSYPLDANGGATVPVTATAAEQIFNVTTDGGQQAACSATLAAALSKCNYDASIDVVSAECGGSSQCDGMPNGDNQHCEWASHNGSTTLTLPAGATNIRMTLTSMYFDDHGGVLAINGQGVADYGWEGNQQGGKMLSHTVYPNVDVSSKFKEGANSLTGTVYNVECPDVRLVAHFTGTYQAPACH